ncbi:protein translocase subunit SecD [Candidatus Peribacteria bacterium]|nr:protein translocase subunit SecD [Candidatus Peribacteria bacterium]MBT4474061.1 protein translocase subunit SecD [Candidatus Peribacteria bacterium]
MSIPNSWKTWGPEWMQPTLHLGLDLQGGTQLDFRISESEMEKQIQTLESEIAQLEADHASQEEIVDRKNQVASIRFQKQNVVEAVRSVLERRVNNLGVSEAVITPSYYGNEKHLLVECPGVVDVQQCINTVGKTILLEFKEQHSGEDKEHLETMRELAEKAEFRITGSGETLETVGQDVGPTLGVYYSERDTFFQDDLPEEIAHIWDKTPEDGVIFEEISFEPIAVDEESSIDNTGIMAIEILGEKEEGEKVFNNPVEAIEFVAESRGEVTLKTREDMLLSEVEENYADAIAEMTVGSVLKGEDAKGNSSIIFVTSSQEEKSEMEASHILIAYKGAVRASESVTRTREEAEKIAIELVPRLDEGAGFNSIAREHSDGPSSVDGGSLGRFKKGDMAKAFEDAAFALSKGGISDAIETEFGFHIIRADSDPELTPGTVSYMELSITGDNAEEAQTEILNGLQERTISKKEEQIAVRSLFFSFMPTGWKDTQLDGKHFQRATVTSDPMTGIPIVQIVFNKEGGDLFYELTKRNVEKPIAIFVGGELISAPVVQSEIAGGVAVITGSSTYEEANTLAQDLNTGAIPAPIHMVGQVTVEATLGSQALASSIEAALIGFVLVGLYMIWYYRVLGLIAALALITYAVVFNAILKLPVFLFTDQYIVLTLAGIAGIILSIGMAVDANVLIFERMKEELKKGKMLQTAADTGFKRAWSSIWASNVSTLLTASILFIIGTSIVRGFAVTLSMGIIISLIIALLVTRFLISLLYKSPIAKNPAAFGVRK